MMTDEWKRYWYDRLIGRRYGKVYRLDRIDVPMGYCEGCFGTHELNPFGPGGKWVCFECAMKNPKVMKEELDKLNVKRNNRLMKATGRHGVIRAKENKD